MVQRPRSAGEPVVRAPPALDLSSLPQDDPTTRHLKTVHDMVECGWPALLAALSFLISTNLSDELFADVLGSYQSMTNVSGMLGLNTPQDAFFTSLSKFAIPTRVVSSLENWVESSTPRTPSTLSENLGLSGPTQPPGLSERNMACLKVLIASALFLAGSLGESWFNILEALQNADYVLTTKGAKFPPSKRSTMGPGVGSAIMSRAASLAGTQSGSSAGKSASSLSSQGVQAQQQPRHPMLADLDSEALQAAIQKLFDASKNMDDGAFSDFVRALCKLSSVMVGMQSGDKEGLVGESEVTLGVGGGGADLTKSPKLGIPESAAHRRRVSGIHLPRTLVSFSTVSVWDDIDGRLAFSALVTSVSTDWEVSLPLIFTALSIAIRRWHGIRLLLISLLLSSTLPHQHRYAYKPPRPWMKSSRSFPVTSRLPVNSNRRSNAAYWMSCRNKLSARVVRSRIRALSFEGWVWRPCILSYKRRDTRWLLVGRRSSRCWEASADLRSLRLLPLLMLWCPHLYPLSPLAESLPL